MAGWIFQKRLVVDAVKGPGGPFLTVVVLYPWYNAAYS
jgi:hypothetical protein